MVLHVLNPLAQRPLGKNIPRLCGVEPAKTQMKLLFPRATPHNRELHIMSLLTSAPTIPDFLESALADAETEQPSQQFQILLPAHHQFHEGQVISIQREDMVAIGYWVQAHFPADGQ